MRAARLLHILLLLQNRGRLTSARLAEELEVSPRTILRDIDALTEAGLPVVTYQGNHGGFELGFNYRSRLTGLGADEAEAFAVLLADPTPALAALGLRPAADRAIGKLVESLPDAVRLKMTLARRQFRFVPVPATATDPRLEALARAIRGGNIVRLRARSSAPRVVHPLALQHDRLGWALLDALAPERPIALAEWGDINISAARFVPPAGSATV